MNIYEEVSTEILNMKYDRKNKKIYKFILILSLIDYYKDLKIINGIFNQDIEVELLLPYYRLYLENEDLKVISYANKSNTYTDKSILTDMCSAPLRHIVTNSKFFKNNDTNLRTGKDNKLSRRISNLPTTLKIEINADFDVDKMTQTIINACYKKIYQITDIKLTASVVDVIGSKESFENNNKENRKSYQRVGQSLYREKLLEKYNCTCALCTINFSNMLVASHAKPWRSCDTIHEKLSEHNGLLLCANHDQLFDKGFIAIDPDTREILYSSKLQDYEIEYIESAKINTKKIKFNMNEHKYFLYHKENIFKT